MSRRDQEDNTMTEAKRLVAKALNAVNTIGEHDCICPLCKHTPPQHWKSCPLENEYWEVEANKQEATKAINALSNALKAALRGFPEERLAGIVIENDIRREERVRIVKLFRSWGYKALADEIEGKDE